ncbi:MAG: M23 family metallopeptidase [Lachnospiraceae bacterium]|jgi:murein DD-endopeptidase MepM/ murein hydrolase activator NlpD|nr:M23 family metallopeptidase [Lachnospiraceae bacterium]
MSPIRKIAVYLMAVLLLGCVVQGEMLWLLELLEERIPSEQSERDAFSIYQETMESVWGELVYFPVPDSSVNEEATTAFENTWMAERTYGGKRSHEGIDVMASIEEAGYYPVVSMTDGAIEQIGWLEKGGYRIGVRSLEGNYYYYAHLHSYAREWEKGDTIQAGEILGYMGDTGYGPEGTTGQFPVHLHVGVYVPLGADQEMAINPYWMLCYLEDKKLEYVY